MKNNPRRTALSLGIVAFILLGACIFVWRASGVSQETIPFSTSDAQVPNYRCFWIGVLKGTWLEMGIQYGERTAPDIRWQFDMMWEKTIKPNSSLYGDLDEKARIKYALDYLEKSFKEFSYICPEITEFMHGIAKGAETELNRSKYADVCSNYMKICVITFDGPLFHPSTSPYYYDLAKPINAYGFVGKNLIETARRSESSDMADDDCHWFYVKGGATTNGEAIAMTQGTHQYDNLRMVAYVAVPDDPKANVFYGFGAPGQVANSGGANFNDKGVALLTSGSQSYRISSDMADETLSPGIRDHLLGFAAVVFSRTAKEAAEYVTVGTPGYRAKTGRKTVLRARGSNTVFADANDCYAVEANSRHYAIRRPGYLGEKNGDFMTGANHFQFKDGSYDENNMWNAKEPMTLYTPAEPYSGTYFRNWSQYWEIANRYGKIDKEMVMREILTSHTAYDEHGKSYLPDPGGVPTKEYSVCTHMGKRTTEHPLGTGGSAKIKVFVPSKLDVYWIESWPCANKDKSWNYLNLKPFADMRKTTGR